MRSDVFLSKEAFAKRECFIKRRQERLIQVDILNNLKVFYDRSFVLHKNSNV